MRVGARCARSSSRDALAWAVGVVDAEEIDRINILNAAILAMHRALDGLQLCPECIIVDGNRFKPYVREVLENSAHHHREGRCEIPVDRRRFGVAKTYRDDYMAALHEEYPDYAWNRNAGYPTAAHRAAIAAHGPTPYHRQSFKLLKD